MSIAEMAINDSIPISIESPAADKPRWRHIFAAVLGGAIEYYDFVIYAFFAVMIGRIFFLLKTQSPACSLRCRLSRSGR